VPSPFQSESIFRTSTAADGGRVLCDEYPMHFDRDLFPIILWERRCQSGRYEINGMGANGVDAFGLDV